MKEITTKEYSATEMKNLKELIKKYFDEWYPRAILKSHEAHYDPLSNGINDYFTKYNSTKKDTITSRYICDIYYGSSTSKKKNIKKINAIVHYIRWAFNEGKIETDIEVKKRKHIGEVSENLLDKTEVPIIVEVPEGKKTIEFRNCGSHKWYYVYYYVSADFSIKFAIVGLDKANKKNEWGNGKIYYLTVVNGLYLITKEYELRKINQKPINKYYRFYQGVFQDRMNLFTITVNGLDEDDRELMFLTYSSIEMQSRASSAGVGIFEKLSMKDFNVKITSLTTKGIDAEISNILFGKKILVRESNSMVVKPGEKFQNKQMRSLNRVKGFWKGYYLRIRLGEEEEGEQSSTEILKSSGLIMFYMHIEDNGLTTLYYEEEDENFKGNIPYKKYTGVIKFPFNESSFMKGKLEYLDDCKMYKLHFWLEYTGTSKEILYSYSGIMSGWINKGHGIFSSPVFMKKINLDNSLKGKTLTEQTNSILSAEKPFRIKQEDLSALQDLAKIKAKFLKKEKTYFSTSENCL